MAPPARRKTSKATTPKSAAELIEIDSPYTLVLYTDKTKGVVCTKSIPKKSRSVGTSCKALNPIDWVSSDDKSKHECFIIEFGRDIDMLYSIRLLKSGLIDPNCNAEEFLAKKREKRENPKSVEERKRENLQKFEDDVSIGGHVFVKEKTIDQSLMSVPSGTSGTTESESVGPNLTASSAAASLSMSIQSGIDSDSVVSHPTSTAAPLNLSASSNYLPPDLISRNVSQNPSANSHYLPPDLGHPNVFAQNQSANSYPLPPAASSLQGFDYPTENVSPDQSETSDKVPPNRGSSFSCLNGIFVSLSLLNDEQGTNSPEINKKNSEEILSDNRTIGQVDELGAPRSPSPLAFLNEGNTAEQVSNIFESNKHSEKILSDAGNNGSQSELIVPDSNTGESNPGCLYQYERPHVLQVPEPDHGQLPGQTLFRPPTPSAYHVQLERDTAESTIAWAFDVNQLECFQPGGPDEKYNIAPHTKLYIMRSEYCCLPLLHPTKGQKIGNSLNPRQMVTFLIKKLLPEHFRKNVLKTNIPPDFFEAFRTFINMRLPLEHKEDDASIRLYIYDACRLQKRNRPKEAEARKEKIKNGIPIKKRKENRKLQGTIIVDGKEVPFGSISM